MFKHLTFIKYMNYYLGLDIGGSRISMGTVRRNRGERVVENMLATPIDSDLASDSILEFLSDTIVRFLDEQGITCLEGIGISVPGSFQCGKGMLRIWNQNKYDRLFGLNFRASLINRLKRKFPVKTHNIIFLNDAQAFLLGATETNSWKEDRRVLGITLGTGLGAGFIEEAELRIKGKGIPYGGYLFNIPFKNGIAEDYLSSWWLVSRYNELKAQSSSYVQDIKQLAEQCSVDQAANQVFREFGYNLAEFLTPISRDFQADRIIMGGDIAKIFYHFKESFLERLEGNGTRCKVNNVENTSGYAVQGVVEHLINNEKKSGDRRVLRSSINPVLPVKKSEPISKRYDVYPAFDIGSDIIKTGFNGLAKWVAKHEKAVIDGYIGVAWNEFVEQLNEQLVQNGVAVNWYCVDAAWKSEEKINEIISPYMGGSDPVFGSIYPGKLSDFFDKQKLGEIQPGSKGTSIIYGSGAAFADPEAPLIYVDVPKNELQYRSRTGNVCNIGALKPLPPKEQYKRFYFVDWVVLNKHKKQLLSKIDIIVDEQRIDEITWMEGTDLRNTLQSMTQHMFRVRPWFESGVWGGKWMKNHIEGLNKDAINYAWSFECIVPENGIVFKSNSKLLEVSFDFLMYHDNHAILGKSADRFGDEFPIRFDFLDTVEGENLSLQCHPTNAYMQERFGENFTQDETYYILDANEDATVYLGFQDDIDPDQFRKVLEESHKNSTPVPVQEFVQTFPASKHDFFLIPAGTVHCSGKGNLVLEISGMPYIYTFKMYDWLRLDLDGKPRPINIERAFENLNFERKGKKVGKELISIPSVINQGNDWQVIHLATHSEHFYDVHRVEFDSKITVDTNNGFHLLNLVEGSSLIVETGDRQQHIHYAETFIIPAAARKYTLINEGEGRAKVVKAFVKE